MSRPNPTRRLPQNPNLEQLRKQAKELQAETSVPLSEAQRELARAYGFESWAQLKGFVDGANVARLAEAVRAGDLAQARALVRAWPELVHMDMAENNEHRALHYAVLRRDPAMVRMLMEAGADARKGIYPHRDATSALVMARDRGYAEIAAIIEEEEQRRRESASCPNVTVTPVQERIASAIRAGESGAARELLEADESLIRACDREGATPLHLAAEAGDAELTAWLLARRANPRKRDLREYTPLDRAALAANQGFPEVARRLLYHGAELTIHAAVALGEEQRVRDLVAQSPGLLREIHWSRGGLLTLAVRHGQLAMVKLLLDLGADPDERTLVSEVEEPVASWGTPLWHAAQAGQYEIARLLLDRGADPNANVYASGWPLRNAYQNEPLRRLLMERGARVQPYMVAEAHDAAAAGRLLESDADREIARELCWAAACHGAADVLRLALPRIEWAADDSQWHWVLIQPIRGVEPDGEDHEGFFACMRLLLERVDANVSSRFGQRVLHFAAADRGVTEEERARFAAMLLDAGARLDVRDDLLRSTPLGWACRWGRRPMVELLLARGALAVEPDAEPWATPAAWAEKMGHAQILEILRAASQR
ncbi:MAG TPA: ankyrin repeat domain-containing protein [Bryobacteraceae bacterium]|nr:ankyrin repeat domain-containing protein [Bryobacteraceae bacterium]